jgi:hypothetical protein
MSVREDVLQFLRAPQAFASSLPANDVQLWRQGLEAFAQPQIAEKGGYPFRESQVGAWNGLSNQRVGLIQGPPGTGKTYLLSWMALGYLQARQAAGLPCRVLLNAFTLNAVGNLLDAIQSNATRYLPSPPELVYLGNQPGGGLKPAVRHISFRQRGAAADAWEALQDEHLIVGCSVWSLNRLLQAGDAAVTDGPTSPLFHLVCIDEASQMVVSNGLMALAGLAPGGRVLVAGDDKQLPPVRSVHDQTIEGRHLGGSLYDFLKSAQVAEFPLDETFRLNAPLTRFPEGKFYPGRYRPTMASADQRLRLAAGWEQDAAPWERVALDPEYPLCVLLHDGPTAGTSNPFEVAIAARLARRLFAAMAAEENGEDHSAETVWQKRLAIVSPHRAQNAAIRAALAQDPAGSGAVVETVDRIQGKERDAIIASYTVSDPEFTLAEAAFIFSLERLNVTITRARTKLILIVSRRLLNVVPPDEETLDAAQTLRELVFDSAEVGTVQIADPTGRKVSVNVRVRGFTEDGQLPPLIEILEEVPAETPPELTKELEELLAAIREIAIKSPYGTAADFEIRKALYLPGPVPFGQLRDLAATGHILLLPRNGKQGRFWVAKPLDPPRPPFPGDPDTVRGRLVQVIAEARSGRFAPFYEGPIRDRFLWMTQSGDDRVWPVIEAMAREGLVRIDQVNGSATVDWVGETTKPEPTEDAPKEPLSDQDFEILNHLEDVEARRINFGIYEGWTSLPELAAGLPASRAQVSDALRRLQIHGHLLRDDEGRIRSRMAELAREVRYVKQRFAVGDADRRPFLVRSLKLELRDRDKPVRDRPLSAVIEALQSAIGDDPRAQQVLRGLEAMLQRHWGQPDPPLAGFQARALSGIFPAWLGRGSDRSFVITADTGAGKTEAAVLPLIAGAAHDRLRGVQGTRAMLVYPRVRLAANQAQRIAGYLARLAEIDGMPTLTLGLQNWQVPGHFGRIHENLQGIWPIVAGDVLRFPFFACPDCGCDLHLHPGQGQAGADRLACTRCAWQFTGWVGSKTGLRESPPDLFLPITESLHQWQQIPAYGALFGDLAPNRPPRAILADEIHLYTHVHGAQVGYALRRVLARAAINAPEAPSPLAIGMSATLGDPARVWRELIGRDEVIELRPEPAERQRNPRGREYFFFVQPEVESRGQDIAGASTSIQSLLCLAHGMRRRTGQDGGYRGIVFLDSIDKLKRLHGDYQDAEEAKGLAALRTRLFDDDPGTNQPRRECCGQPATCDRFRTGECWYFAANDSDQVTARGRYRPGSALAVSERPVYSGERGNVEEMIRRADLVFATSSLEVGYDDPDMALVYQHYAPKNLASFIQRKGRGGRGLDDRPVTGVTLSPYSPRDSWYFRRPERMLDSGQFDVPLNAGNHFVRRGQVLATLLDALARHLATQAGAGLTIEDGRVVIAEQPRREAEGLIRAIFGHTIYRELEVADLDDLCQQAIAQASAPIGTGTSALDLREALPWVPRTLFATVNLPELAVRFQNERGEHRTQQEDINLALEAATPGNMTRRYGFSLLHWVPPKAGRNAWLSDEVYRAATGFTIPPLEQGSETLLRELPLEAREDIGPDIHPKICRPGGVALEVAGRMRGDWTAHWYYDAGQRAVLPIGKTEPDNGVKVHHKSRGSLRGFSYVEARPGAGHPLSTRGIGHFAEHFEAFYGARAEDSHTGLTVTALYWGGDAELRLMDPAQPDIPITQTFIHPRSGKTLLHGYRVETEGVRLHLNSHWLTDFIDAEVERQRDHPDGRWHRGQMFRYLIGSQARAAGINAYEANRAADLLFSAAGHPDLRARLRGLTRRWDAHSLRDLLQQTFSEMLACHPLLSERRVDRLADALGDQRFQRVFANALEAVRATDQFAGYLRSVLIHSLVIRLKQAFVLHGRGDEREVLLHAKLPIQFGTDAEDIITVAENGAHGDGTTRMFGNNLGLVLEDWSTGGLAECPNAREDALIDEAFRQTARHAAWRALDPRSPEQMCALAADLGIANGRDGASMQGIMRLLYGWESVGLDRFDLYSLHQEIRAIDTRLRETMGREPSQWELVSAVVRAAAEDNPEAPRLAALIRAYQGLEEACQEESLRAESRLAEQAYRLSARLCVDGCQGCLHSGSDLMPGALAEPSVSRRLLERLTADCSGGIGSSSQGSRARTKRTD